MSVNHFPTAPPAPPTERTLTRQQHAVVGPVEVHGVERSALDVGVEHGGRVVLVGQRDHVAQQRPAQRIVSERARARRARARVRPTVLTCSRSEGRASLAPYRRRGGSCRSSTRGRTSKTTWTLQGYASIIFQIIINKFKVIKIVQMSNSRVQFFPLGASAPCGQAQRAARPSHRHSASQPPPPAAHGLRARAASSDCSERDHTCGGTAHSED